MRTAAFHCTLFAFLLSLSCGKYHESGDFNGIVSRNDLAANFRIRHDDDHLYKMAKIREAGNRRWHLQIDVIHNFSLSTGEVPVVHGKKYRLSLTLKNPGANPILLYSFWKKPQDLSRHYAFAGEKGNPPYSKT
jgi:hypothetical protein